MADRTLPSAIYLRECFEYDAVTGALTWQRRPISHFKASGMRSAKWEWKRWNTRYANRPAGTPSAAGKSHSVRIDRTDFRTHRVIWKFVTGDDPPGIIDHWDLNSQNNAWDNLRIATRGQNATNSLRLGNGRGGRFKGVSPRGGRWIARITVNGKRRSLGYFDTPEAAHAAYKVAAAADYGDFANFGHTD